MVNRFIPGRGYQDIRAFLKSPKMRRKRAESSQQKVDVSQAADNPDTTEKSSSMFFRVQFHLSSLLFLPILLCSNTVVGSLDSNFISNAAPGPTLIVAKMARARADGNPRKQLVTTVLVLVFVGAFFYLYSRNSGSSSIEHGIKSLKDVGWKGADSSSITEGDNAIPKTIPDGESSELPSSKPVPPPRTSSKRSRAA
ncbi:hypothetical protein RIF29_33492 [Crotalaria pallida]|uniref:Transmembrane protein n=1 Tax=Crotalaria pallida TaxID=3830 RepID=A0AAN9EDQ9_CROPI